MTRQDIIDSLTRNGYHYDFDKYGDQQLFRIWQDKQNKISPAERAQMEREFAKIKPRPKCENCGRPLDDSGTCPVCDQGEEDYGDSIFSAKDISMSGAEKRIEEFASIDKMHKAFVEDIEDDILDFEGDNRIANFIERLQGIVEYGCASGTVPSLIYYDDTEAYYNTYYDEIYDFFADEYVADTVIEHIKSNSGSTSLLMNDRYAKNDIVWVVYEYMASELLDLLDQDRYDAVYWE